MRVNTSGKDPSQAVGLDLTGYDSFEEAESIFYNWDKYGVDDYHLVRQLFDEAIDSIISRFGGFPDCDLANLPSYRTSKVHLLKKIPKKSTMQLVP